MSLKLNEGKLRLPGRFRQIIGYLNRKEEELAQSDGLSATWQWLIFVVASVAVFSRCPSLLTRAQFYAEDGRYWYAQAYNGGWLHSLTLPYGGYLVTLQRLGAGLALLFPLRWAPLVMVTIGLLIQAVPVPILLSARCRNWGTLPVRALFAALYVALPNAKEIHVVLTNSQWHLALAAVLLGFSCSPKSWRGRVVDCVVFLVAGFTGPFCIFLAPMVLLFWWLRRQLWSLAIVALMTVGSLGQIYFLLHANDRIRAPLGAGLAPLLRMFGGNIVACAIFGGYPLGRLAPMALIVPGAIFGLAVCLYCLWRANLELKMLLVYSAVLFAASLRSPLIPPLKPLWEMLVYQNSCRYWFFPSVTFVWCLVWCSLYARTRILKLAAACAFLCMSIGIVDSWDYRGYPDANYALSVQHMREAKPGEHVVIPIAPEGFDMELVKKGP